MLGIASSFVSVTAFSEILKGAHDEILVLRPNFKDYLQIGERTSNIVFNIKASALLISPSLCGLIYDKQDFWYAC